MVIMRKKNSFDFYYFFLIFFITSLFSSLFIEVESNFGDVFGLLHCCDCFFAQFFVLCGVLCSGNPCVMAPGRRIMLFVDEQCREEVVVEV